MPYGTYLTRSRHRTNWYARIVIPHDLRHAYDQRREIRKTLDTPCKVTARRPAMMLWLAYQQVFDSLRNGQAKGSITPEWKALASLATSPVSSQTADISPRPYPASRILYIIPLVAVDRNEKRLTVSQVGINPVTGNLIASQAPQAALKGAGRLCKAWVQGNPQGSQHVVSGSFQQAQASSTSRSSQRISGLFNQFAAERIERQSR